MKLIPTIQTGSLLLRPLTMQDAPAVFAYSHDQQVSKFTQWQTHVTINDTQRFIYNNQQKPLWALIDQESETIIGECGFKQRTDIAELHCALARPYWGHGYAMEGLKAIMELSFAELHVKQFQAWIIDENKQSISVARKLGMKHSGTLVQAWYASNALHDIHVYSLNK